MFANDLIFEAPNDLVAVEAQVFGIGAHEPHGIRVAGKVLEAAILDRFQVDVANLENIGDLAKIIADPQARGFQERADAGGAVLFALFIANICLFRRSHMF